MGLKRPRVSLNPCFSGSWFLRQLLMKLALARKSLNPCFSGSWFLSIVQTYKSDGEGKS